MFTPLITDTSKKFGNNRWLAYSNKLNRTVYLFSDLEYEHWLHLEFNSNIINFCETNKFHPFLICGFNIKMDMRNL